MTEEDRKKEKDKAEMDEFRKRVMSTHKSFAASQKLTKTDLANKGLPLGGTK
jgi:hypothetical protein